MSGHGWVTPNPDGSKARCGGPAICSACAREKAAAEAAIAARLTGASSSGQQTATAPAETMRRAAALMRERAQAATPGPWCWEATGDKDSSWAAGLVQDEAGNALSGEIGHGEGVVIDGVCESIDGEPADGEHIASWHPLVALAVADLLDKLAWMGEMDPDLLGRVGCDEALAIARAYLGEEVA